jgi:hypothetical protein
MANPRLEVSYDGFLEEIGGLTFEIDDSTIEYDADESGGSTGVGKAVTLSADKTVALAGAGVDVLGQLDLVQANDYATVQVIGYMKFPKGTNAAGNMLGMKIVGDVDGSGNAGYVREVDSSAEAELDVARGIVINDDGTYVEVLLF